MSLQHTSVDIINYTLKDGPYNLKMRCLYDEIINGGSYRTNMWFFQNKNCVPTKQKYGST